MLRFDNDKNAERSGTIIAVAIRIILIIFILSLLLFGCNKKSVVTSSTNYPINREVVIDIPYVDNLGQQQTIQHKIFIDSIKVDEKVVVKEGSGDTNIKKIVDRSKTKVTIRTDNSTDLRRSDVGSLNQVDVSLDSATSSTISILPNQSVEKTSNNNKRTNFLDGLKNVILVILGVLVLLIVYKLVR